MALRLVDEKHPPTHDPSREAWVGATQRDHLPFARMAFHAENLAPSCGTGICAAFDPFSAFRPPQTTMCGSVPGIEQADPHDCIDG